MCFFLLNTIECTRKRNLHNLKKEVAMNHFLTFSSTHTHIHQKRDFLIIHRTIQCHDQPMGLIHVPTGEDARLHSERANQSGIAFQIHDTDFSLAGQTQIFLGISMITANHFLFPLCRNTRKLGYLAKRCSHTVP